MTDESGEDAGRIKATIESINQQKNDVAGSVQQDLGERRDDIKQKADRINQETYDIANKAVDEARQSVHDVQYELNKTADGAEVVVKGKISDVKSFEKELERQIGGHDVSISVDIDYDVDGELDIDFS